MNPSPSRVLISATRTVSTEDLLSAERDPIRSLSKYAFDTLQHIPDNVFTQDIEGRILVANRALATTFDYSCPHELIGKTVIEAFPTETAGVLQATAARIIATGKPILDRDQNIIDLNGRSQWIRTNHIPLYDKAHKIIGIVCTFRDITDTKETERLLLAQANLLDMVAQSAPLAEICLNIIAVVEGHLPGIVAAVQLLSPDRTRLVGSVSSMCNPDLCGSLEELTGSLGQMARSAIETGGAVEIADINLDLILSQDAALSKSGFKAVWSVPIFSLEGMALGAMTVMSKSVGAPTTVQADLIAMASHMVSAAVERQETAERNKFLASHDSLTSLPNRMLFEERLSAAVEASRESQCHIGLAFFDLDNFKLINDSLGHGAGDILLKTVAARAQGSLRKGDVVARIGGDEFVMFLTDLPDQSQFIEQRFQDIREAISQPTDIDGRMIQVTCSMGVAYFPSHAETAATLISNADVAMYRAKQFGRDNMQVFAPNMQNTADERLSRISSLRDAVAREEFILHYQPQIDIDTGLMFGAECLVRWNHPDLGLLHPGDFISMAEETGLIVPLGDWVLLNACRQNKEWQDQGLPAIVISVNVSARQFRGSNLVEHVASALQISGLEARYLELELTESLIMHEGSSAKMHELAALGVKLAIDDFGTGYSSLSALKHFPVHRLKIDRSFIRDISNDESDQAITGAIIVMAKKLNMKVIAEGVETCEQLSFVHQLGCKEVQGYYFSKPVGPESFIGLLAESSGFLHDAFVGRGDLDDEFDGMVP